MRMLRRNVRIKAKCDQLQKDFLRLIERDAEVFEPLSKAYGMPKETEEEKAEKARVMEIVLKRCLLCTNGNHGEML